MWEQILSMMGGNLLGGISDLIKDFRLPPEQAAQLETRLAEIESQARTAIETVAAQDRQSARQREMALRDTTPKILAFGITVGFFGIMGYMLVEPLPEAGHDVLLVLLGSLGTAWTAIVTYYFGSSAGSTAKSETIRDLKKGAA
jgi:hypothetical protein